MSRMPNDFEGKYNRGYPTYNYFINGITINSLQQKKKAHEYEVSRNVCVQLINPSYLSDIQVKIIIISTSYIGEYTPNTLIGEKEGMR